MATKPKEDPLAALDSTYEFLKKVRESKTVTLKPISMLRSEIKGIDGKVTPFRLRYYQVQAITHLMVLKRMVLGDATGTGKTLNIIASLCYVWERETTNKAVIVAPKSAIRQWASEVHKFAEGITVYIADGNPEERIATYKEFQDHPTTPGSPKAVLVMKYASLVRDWNQGAKVPLKPNGHPDVSKPMTPGLLENFTAQIPNLTVVYDECFEYHTPVLLADGTERLIGKIVCGKEEVSVLSWNWAKGVAEPKKVMRWIRNPLRKNKRLVKLSFLYSNSVVVTNDHKVYRPDGSKVEVRDLKKGSTTAHLSTLIPSQDQLQVILGGLLGDASVSHPKRALWGVSFTQGSAQEKYLQFKREALLPLGVSRIRSGPSGYGGATVYNFRMKSNPYLCSVVSTHREGRKHPSIEWLDLVTPLGLAVWYGDDGSLQTDTTNTGASRFRITLNTQGFTLDENELLAGWLRWKWGVDAQISQTGGYYVLYLPHDAAAKFLSLLPGSLPGVEYKFPGKMPVGPLDAIPQTGLVHDQVVAKTVWTRAKKEREHVDYVYDLEVEGNHNYIANGSLVSNCTAFKNSATKTWQVCHSLSMKANRCYGLTATLLKNNLIEGWAIFNVIFPGVFTTKTRFLEDYCVTKLQPVANRRKIPIVVGYKNLDKFRARIDRVFLGRAKHLISDELPKLITKEVKVVLSPAEDAKYAEALTGILSLGNGDVKDYEETKKLVSLNYCQQVVDSLSLLKYEEGHEIWTDLPGLESDKVKELGSKEQALLDLVEDEFDDEKVIVYVRYASLIPRLQEIFKKAGIKNVCITGQVVDTKKNPARQKAMLAFQDPDSKVRVIFISDAGSESINLQAASAMIFYDSPWSWGNYVQLLGRPIRIGSPHQHVIAVHLVAERPSGRSRKTIDHYTLEILAKKKDIIDKVLGESAVGALDFGGASFADELLKTLRDSGVKG